MNWVKEVFVNYYTETPLSLAAERTQEVQVFRRIELIEPTLDIGCGDGIFAKNAFNDQLSCGLDLNNRELEVARKSDSYQTLVLANASDIPFRDGEFKTVISNSVMEHMDNLDQVLDEIYRVLSDDGALHVTIPTEKFEKYSNVFLALNALNLKSLSQKYAKFYNKFWRHKNVKSKDTWESFFREHNFVVMESFNYNSKSQTRLNDFLAWLAPHGWLLKKTTNRWTFMRTLRKRFISHVLFNLFDQHLKLNIDEKGSLIYFKLQKNEL